MYYISISVKTFVNFLRPYKTTFKNTIETNSNIINAFFSDSLTTDNSSVSVTDLSKNTTVGSYALAKSGSDFTLDGVTMTVDGSVYTVPSGNASGMKLTISDTNITSANIYYGECLLTKIEDSVEQMLTFNGDIEKRLTNLRDHLSDIPDRETLLERRIEDLTERYAMQYSVMDSIVAGMKETGNMISQMLETKD